MGLIGNKMMLWPSAREGHLPPITACIIIPRQQNTVMLERKKREASSSGKIDQAAVAWLPSMSHISL